MTLKRIGAGLLAIIICAICLELGERFEIPGILSVVSTAEAIVARPLTPMSYACERHDAVQQAFTTASPGLPGAAL